MKFTSVSLSYHNRTPVAVSDELLEQTYGRWYLDILCNLKVGYFRDTDFNRITRIA